MPVVPVTQEAEVRGSLKPGWRKLQLAEISPLHSSLGDRVRLCLKKKKKKKEKGKTQTYEIELINSIYIHRKCILLCLDYL